jgi:hypothetical protein
MTNLLSSVGIAKEHDFSNHYGIGGFDEYVIAAILQPSVPFTKDPSLAAAICCLSVCEEYEVKVHRRDRTVAVLLQMCASD